MIMGEDTCVGCIDCYMGQMADDGDTKAFSQEFSSRPKFFHLTRYVYYVLSTRMSYTSTP